MKKTLLTLAIAAFTLTVSDAVAQDNAVETKTERSVADIKKEADALQNRIEQYTIKVEANKDNPKMDYEAEKARLGEWKAKWESMTGKTWTDKKEGK